MYIHECIVHMISIMLALADQRSFFRFGLVFWLIIELGKNGLQRLTFEAELIFPFFQKRMQQIMRQCFFAVKSKLHCRLGFFDLIGCDFMIDEDFKVGATRIHGQCSVHNVY